MKRQGNYFDDGYMVVKSLLPSEELKLLQSVIEKAVDQHARILLSEGKIDDIAESAPFDF